MLRLVMTASFCVMLCLMMTPDVMAQPQPTTSQDKPTTTVEDETTAATTQAPRGIPPKLHAQPSDKLFKTDERVVLECSATGVPAPTYSWLKDGHPLNPDQTPNILISSGVDGRLEIDPAYPVDEGKYQCLVDNGVAKVLSRTANLQRARMAALMDTEPEVYSVQEGDSLVIGCPLLRSVPPSVQEWMTTNKDRLEHHLDPSDRVVVGDDGNLYISHVVALDVKGGAVYTRTEYNGLLDLTAHNCPSILNVTSDDDDADVDNAPELLYKTSGVEEDEDSTESTEDEDAEKKVFAVADTRAKLMCIFSGKPVPAVEWSRKDGTALSPRHKATGSKLVINDMQEADVDTYICTGSNRAGEASAEIKLELAVAPRFEEEDGGLKDTTAPSGGEAEFECDLEANPEATIQWFVDGKRVEDGGKYGIHDDGEELTVDDITVEEGGTMTVQCEATNVHGSLMSTAYVTVGASGSGRSHVSGIGLLLAMTAAFLMWLQ